LHKGEAMEENDEDRMSYYLEIGAIEVAGVDETGELIFEIKESAKEIAPELWEAHMDYVDRNLTELYQAGLIKVDYDENLEATISLSQEGYEIAKQKGLIPIDMPDIPNN
jgi:hypothetical protein